MVTKQDFLKYENVRHEGKFNMFSFDAINATGLTPATYYEIITNYNEYYEKYMK